MGLFNSKKKAGDDGLDVLTEIKEPFSFAGFFEEHIAGRIKRMKKFLEEKGILFFLLSPFQQRNRLILQLVIIVFGILLGVVPRSMNLVEQAKERNAASEMAGLIEKNTQVRAGSINIRPLASSQYEKQHMLAFSITSSSGGAIPSTANRFKVQLVTARGVSDAEHVTFAYEVYPISEAVRVLLVYVDNRNQNDETGIYNLSVEVIDDQLKTEDKTPLEIVLSNTQETNELFDVNGVDLAVLTDLVLNNPNTPIKKAHEELDAALKDYELEAERIANLPLGMAAVPDIETLTNFAKGSILYPDLNDMSTTKDIVNMPEQENKAVTTYPVGILMNGITYSKEYQEDLKEQEHNQSGTVTAPDADTDTSAGDDMEGIQLSEEEEKAFAELSSLQTKADGVTRAVDNINNACLTRYKTLKDYKLTLNQEVDISKFSEGGTVAVFLE